MFMGLTTEAADGSVIPGAAESWTISDDGTVYTFTLRDHTWSDGTPVTADDFVFALAADPRSREAAEYAFAPLHDQERQGASTRAPAEHGPLGVARGRPEDPRDHAREPDPVLHRAADPLHRVPDAQAQGRGARRRLGQARQHRRQRRLHRGRVGAQQPRQDGEERRLLRRRQRRDRRGRLLPGRGAQRRDQALSRRRDRRPVRLRLRADRLAEGEPAGSDPHLARARGLLLRVQHQRAAVRRRRVRQALAMAVDREAITEKVLRTGELPAYSLVPPDTGNYGEPRRSTGRTCRTRSGSRRPRRCSPRPASAPTIRSSFSSATTPRRTTRRSRSRSPRCGSSSASQTELFNTEVKVHYNDLQAAQFPGRARRLDRRLQRSRELPLADGHLDRVR